MKHEKIRLKKNAKKTLLKNEVKDILMCWIFNRTYFGDPKKKWEDKLDVLKSKKSQKNMFIIIFKM